LLGLKNIAAGRFVQDLGYVRALNEAFGLLDATARTHLKKHYAFLKKNTKVQSLVLIMVRRFSGLPSRIIFPHSNVI
jgi:hypothetical protein